MPNTSEVTRTETTDANPQNRRTRLVVLWALAVILAAVTAGMLIYLRAKSDVEAYYNELIGSSVPTAVTTVTFEKISFSSESWITLHFRGEFETPSHSADLSVDAEGAADSEAADDTEDIVLLQMKLEFSVDRVSDTRPEVLRDCTQEICPRTES